MRSREVMVHAIDLGTGLAFADLPGDSGARASPLALRRSP